MSLHATESPQASRPNPARVGRRRYRALAFACALAGVSGCAFVMNTRVDDLMLDSVSVAEGDQIPHSAQWRPQKGRKVLLISLQTSHDIRQIAASLELDNLHADIGFCGTSDRAEWSRVYQSGQQVGPFSDPRERERLAAEKSGGEPHSYEVWLDYRTLAHRSGHGFVDYDLAKNPKDLCLTIGGTPHLAVGTGLATNTVLVPKEAIAAAIAQAEQ